MDACLTGCGGLTSSQFFHCEFPSAILAQFPSIHHLEALAILVACRSWGSSWQCVLLSIVITKQWLAHLILVVCKTLCWPFVCLLFGLRPPHEFELRATHLSSSVNRLADLLSRRHVHSSFKTQFLATPGPVNLQEIVVHPSIYSLSDDI